MKKLTEAECLKNGGHCWNYHQGNDIVDEFGNQTGMQTLICFQGEIPKYRTCKHCGKKEKLKSSWENKE